MVAVALVCMPSSGPADAAAAVVDCPTPAPAPKTILTIGDSITAGVTMSGDEGPSYRAELGRLLTEACVPHTFVVAGANGTTCGYWTSRLAGLMLTYQPDVVLLNCGTNDNLVDLTQPQISVWEGGYRALITTILTADPDALVYPAWVQYSAGRMTDGCPWSQGSSPTWRPHSQAIVNDAIYRAVNSLPAYRGRIPAVIDYQPIPEGYLDVCGIHPTPGGYDLMGRIAYNTIAARLVSPPLAELPCGLTGRRPGHLVGSWTPCQRMVL